MQQGFGVIERKIAGYQKNVMRRTKNRTDAREFFATLALI